MSRLLAALLKTEARALFVGGVAMFAFLFGGRALAVAIDPQDSAVEVPTADAMRRLAQQVAALEARIARIESALQGPVAPPIEPPVEPPVDPPIERPPVDPGDWPAVSTVSFTLDDVSVSFGAPGAREWTNERGWRFCVRRRMLGDTLAMLFLEQFEGYDATRVTWVIANAFPDTGAVLFDDLSIRIASRRAPLYEIRGDAVPGPDAIQVRGMLARRSYLGPQAPSLAAYEHATPTEGYPSWAADVCSKGLANIERSFEEGAAIRVGVQRVGPYRIGDPAVRGASSLNGSHGGWKVAPWHMGPHGWQRTSRDGYRWAEADMFAQLDRSPLAVFDPSSLHPLNQHSPYWPGRANVTIPGFKADPDPECPYLPKLETWEAHAYSHFARNTQPPAMLAEFDAFARWQLVEIYWHDMVLWLDGKESQVDLFKTAQQIMRELPANQGWGNGGRGFAHAVRAYLFARPYFPPAMRNDGRSEGAHLYHPGELGDGSLWSDVIPALIEHVARPNGVILFMERDDKHANVAPAARAREVDLMYTNLLDLGLVDIAKACRKTMSPVRGVSVAASFDPRYPSWKGGAYAVPNYYRPYDWIRSDSLELIDLNEVWLSPNEQTLSMIPPEVLGVTR